MKTALILILPTVLFALAAAQAPQSEAGPTFTNTVIDPGLSVGPLKLGDSRDRALELFPQKPEDQQWDDVCGTTLDWIDADNPMGRGEVLIRINKDKVFQIESVTTRFKTAEGITTFNAPEDVRNIYKGMRAYTLLTAPIPALGDRPLVFWVDKKHGIAFAFAYDPSHHKRYVYKIIVFVPGKEFCPEQEKTSSPKWQGIAPYSVEPPPELSPEHY
jgi:hypothetical protein